MTGTHRSTLRLRGLTLAMRWHCEAYLWTVFMIPFSLRIALEYTSAVPFENVYGAVVAQNGTVKAGARSKRKRLH